MPDIPTIGLDFEKSDNFISDSQKKKEEEKKGKEKEQGRIHSNPVADGWAGAVMQKPLGIQKCDGPTDRPTYRPTRQGVESRVRTKKRNNLI